ncbi:winged helix-turn-helix domain-containing protein [Pseudonocardia sp. HH130630-07]|uniref:winged helix-turn-helix domain-containing protein n=1 Tax=Pseudonocardia sp. HH130630-07 TaxID=1690815 RepID=UPI0008150C53|nr:winged helix-turn-helix domain-containing protein [Pseudonocardia sp. HH130630-07]ANY08845.1 hypothetical protein AFB00_24185 [Pseudonocardia sp. HH130630-07]
MNSAATRDSFPLRRKYLHVAEQLRSHIEDGTWPAGSRLPVERELADSHAVSINTLRRAVRDLVAEGLVQRRQGSGT